MSDKILLLDCTLRDGGYYNSWDFSLEIVHDYLNAMIVTGVDVVELGLRSLKNEGFKGAYAYSTDDFLKSLSIPNELKVGYCPIAFVRTNRSAVRMSEIKWKMGKDTANKKLDAPHSIKANEMAELVFEPQQPFVIDSFKSCEGLGRVAILEGNGVVMLGKCISVEFKE